MKNSLALRSTLVASCLVLLSFGCAGRAPYAPLDKRMLKGSGTIYLVPLGDFPADVLEDLVAHYRDKYDLRVETTRAVPLSLTAINVGRGQLAAEKAIAVMKEAHPELVADPGAILIGLTDVDMYIAQYDWRFSFSFRQEGRYAVVSSARMSLGSRAKPAGTEARRLRKMVTKNVGLLYYRLPQSNHPRSVLYRGVGGISELDYMGEEF